MDSTSEQTPLGRVKNTINIHKLGQVYYCVVDDNADGCDGDGGDGGDGGDYGDDDGDSDGDC